MPPLSFSVQTRTHAHHRKLWPRKMQKKKTWKFVTKSFPFLVFNRFQIITVFHLHRFRSTASATIMILIWGKRRGKKAAKTNAARRINAIIQLWSEICLNSPQLRVALVVNIWRTFRGVNTGVRMEIRILNFLVSFDGVFLQFSVRQETLDFVQWETWSQDGHQMIEKTS